jgi:hypothetical protein
MTTPIQTFGTELTWNGVTVAHVMDINGPGETAESEDITNHSSPQAYREKIPIILDGGDVTFDLVYVGETGQNTLRTAFEARSVDTVVLTLPDTTTITFDGFVSNWGWAVPVAGTLRGSIGITVSGPVAIVDAGS